MRSLPLHRERMAPHPLDISKLLPSEGPSVLSPSPHVESKKVPERREASGAPSREERLPAFEKPVRSPVSPTLAYQEESVVKIKPEFWNQLNEESRRMLTSRIWKSTDFNPLLAELDDISKLTEKWLKWAVPTYVNGLGSGPIREWLEGRREARDFHYVLVGEHLKHLKEMRSKRKDGEDAIENSQDQKQNDLNNTELTPSVSPLETPTMMAKVDSSLTQQGKTNSPSTKKTDVIPTDSSSAPSPQTSSSKSVSSKSKEAAIRELDEHIAWFQAYVESKKKPSSGTV